MKVIYLNCRYKDVNESDPRSNAHYSSSSEVVKIRPEKNIQACTEFEPMTSAIPVQRSTK